jgi:23S rRNA (guanosine2251-2'-O)-methyltransferase
VPERDRRHRRGGPSPRGDRPDDDRIVPGRRPVAELLRAGHSAERILIADGALPGSVVTEIRALARGAAVPVRVVPRREVERLAGGVSHQGIVAVTARYRYAPLNDLVGRPDPLVLFLDRVSDPHNLGSLIRSADGAGFDGVVVPARGAAGVTAAVRRVAAGAAEVVPVARVGGLPAALDAARAAGLWIVGLDTSAERDLWDGELLEPPLGMVLGSEGKGMSDPVRGRCDELVRIPTRGRLSSLNVAVAGAIAMFEVARRKRLRIEGSAPAEGFRGTGRGHGLGGSR